MNRTVLVLMMAVTVEALVEYAKTFGKAILEKQWKTAATVSYTHLLARR